MKAIESLIWVIVTWWLTVFDLSLWGLVITVVIGLVIVGIGWWLIKRV